MRYSLFELQLTCVSLDETRNPHEITLQSILSEFDKTTSEMCLVIAERLTVEKKLQK